MSEMLPLTVRVISLNSTSIGRILSSDRTALWDISVGSIKERNFVSRQGSMFRPENFKSVFSL